MMINNIRNLVFHVPANKEAYETRVKWVILLPKNRMLENSQALGKYISSAKLKYPEDSKEITEWTVHWDNAEIEKLNEVLEKIES